MTRRSVYFLPWTSSWLHISHLAASAAQSCSGLYTDNLTFLIKHRSPTQALRAVVRPPLLTPGREFNETSRDRAGDCPARPTFRRRGRFKTNPRRAYLSATPSSRLCVSESHDPKIPPKVPITAAFGKMGQRETRDTFGSENAARELSSPIHGKTFIFVEHLSLSLYLYTCKYLWNIISVIKKNSRNAKLDVILIMYFNVLLF